MRGAASLLDIRFGYLDSVPWAFSRADTQEGATEVLRQIDSAPDSAHDHRTLEFRDRFRGDLETVRDGNAPSQELIDEVAKINLASIDESSGEGYHRSTNVTRIRCPGAKTPYTMQDTRFLEHVSLMKSVL